MHLTSDETTDACDESILYFSICRNVAEMVLPYDTAHAVSMHNAAY